jgi:hypothetical protein
VAILSRHQLCCCSAAHAIAHLFTLINSTILLLRITGAAAAAVAAIRPGCSIV